MLDNEEYVPAQVDAHERHQAGGHVGVHIHTGLSGNTPGVDTQL